MGTKQRESWGTLPVTNMLNHIHCWLFGHDDLWYLSPGEVRVKCFYCDRISPGFKHLQLREETRCDSSSLHLR